VVFDQDLFFVGARVNLYAHEFLIVSADEPTLRFMERHRDKFPFSFIRVGWADTKGGFWLSKGIREEIRLRAVRHARASTELPSCIEVWVAHTAHPTLSLSIHGPDLFPSIVCLV
jgi:hypothetical protein